MLKKTITYEDFNGEEVSEDFFFHLSKAELIELEMSHSGGLSAWLQNVVAAEDGKTIIEEFKKIILTAYGQKSPDGRRFIKNQGLRDEFASTEAYSVLFVELVTNTDAAIEFVNGVIPQGLAEEAMKVANTPPPALAVVGPPGDPIGEPGIEGPPGEPMVVTRAAYMEMSTEDALEFRRLVESGQAVLSEE